MNHYERIGAMLRLLATGPKPLDELREAISSKHNTDVYRTRERAEQAGFLTTQAGGIVALSGGPTLNALMNYQETTMPTYTDTLSGDIIEFSDEVQGCGMFPLPTDNWYKHQGEEADLRDLPEWGCAPRSPFLLVDDGGSDGARWRPIGAEDVSSWRCFCIASAIEQGWDGKPDDYETTADDIWWITEQFQREVGRKPTAEEWRAAGMWYPGMADAYFDVP